MQVCELQTLSVGDCFYHTHEKFRVLEFKPAGKWVQTERVTPVDRPWKSKTKFFSYGSQVQIL